MPLHTEESQCGAFFVVRKTRSTLFFVVKKTLSNFFFVKRKVEMKKNRGFKNTKTKLQKLKASFHQTIFCYFDGFAKPHPSTPLFRETIPVVTRNQLEFDRLNGWVQTRTRYFGYSGQSSQRHWISLKSSHPVILTCALQKIMKNAPIHDFHCVARKLKGLRV